MASFRSLLTSSGIISGTGFAKAKIIGCADIFFTISSVRILGFESPKNISAPRIASLSVLSFVLMANSSLYLFKSVRSTLTTPRLSKSTICSTPKFRYILAHAIPAAPAPLMTTLMSLIFLPLISIALISPALDIIAVPCWSSCITGMPMFCKAASISKHFGAAMSSKFMPPTVGASALQKATISSTECASISMS